MAQSQNTRVEFQTKGVSYMGLGSKVGQFLIGDKAFEFYPDSNVERYIQIPWTDIRHIGANVNRQTISRHFEIHTQHSRFLFASKDSGRILKIAREHIGNEKVVQLPTLIQTITKNITSLFAKKS